MTRKTKPASPGERFGKLVVIGESFAGRDGNYLPCICDCGVPVYVLWRILNSRGRTSCGTCRTQYKKERLYRIWGNMKSRCLDENNPSYQNYGGRGITIDENWINYLGFREWALASGYRDDLTIERSDNDGNYEPGNCIWLPKGQQSQNRRSVIRIEYEGETKILSEWAKDERCAVNYQTLYMRITRGGWTFADALTTPPGNQGKGVTI